MARTKVGNRIRGPRRASSTPTRVIRPTLCLNTRVVLARLSYFSRVLSELQTEVDEFIVDWKKEHNNIEGEKVSMGNVFTRLETRVNVEEEDNEAEVSTEEYLPKEDDDYFSK